MKQSKRFLGPQSAQLEFRTLDFAVVSLSPMLGVEIFFFLISHRNHVVDKKSILNIFLYDAQNILIKAKKKKILEGCVFKTISYYLPLFLKYSFPFILIK